MIVSKESFARFIYPFLFDPGDFERRATDVEAATYKPQKPTWRTQRFPEEEVLSHVARYLNPPEGTDATAHLWRLQQDALESPEGVGARKSIDWCLRIGKDRELGFCLEDVQLSLFRVGVGFLTVRARPKSNEIADWLDFIHYFRFLRRTRSVQVCARQRVGVDDAGQPVLKTYRPHLAEPATDGTGDGPFCFGAVLDGLLRHSGTDDEKERWWLEVFIAGVTLPYTGLFVDGVSTDEERQLLYQLHNCFHSREGNHPAPEDLCLPQPHLLPYARRQWFVFSLECGAFLACDVPSTDEAPFFRETLPSHVDVHYLLGFLLALHQRFTLASLSDQVAGGWDAGSIDESEETSARREELFRRIRHILFAFTAKGQFVQVMQRQHHHRCYLKWQETLQVPQLFDEVSREVREMHEYLMVKKTERIEQLADQQKERTEAMARRLNWLAAFFGVPALVFSFLQVIGGVSCGYAFAFLLAALALGWLGLKLILESEVRSGRALHSPKEAGGV